MPRTVLFFESHSGFFDGGQQSLYLLVKHLDRKRFRPILAGPEEGPLTRRLGELGVPTVIVRPDARLSRYGGAVLRDGMWGRTRLLLSYAAYSRRIRRIMKAERVEIVHCNSIRSLLTVGPVARAAGVPLIWHLRIIHDLGRWNRLALRLADRVMVVSDRLKELFPAGRGSRDKFVTVYNGVDVSAFEGAGNGSGMRAELGIEPGWQVVGTIGSITPRKGQLDFLRAAPRVIRALPQTKFVLVGEARGLEGQAYAERLRAYVAGEGLERHVIFAGWREDVARILSGLDLFVLPSLNEGLPRVILEAMAASVPVIATRVCGNADLVVDGQTGLLVPPEEPDALASAVTRILGDPDLGRSMGRQGRRRVQKEFSLEASVRGVEAVIDTLLARHGDVRVATGDPRDASIPVGGG